MKIPFNKPYMSGKELEYIRQAHENGWLAGNGPFTKKCNQWIEKELNCLKALLTHSCTAALEMSAVLSDIHAGDEILMPSYTFVSTANSFVLRGGKPIFIDIRPDTLNIDENLIESAVSEKTKCIVAVHYAGVGCEMDKISEIGNKYNLLVIEDAAQGILSTYKGRPLGTIGDIGCLSFHETKNIISGEGGAILVNNEKFFERAEIILEKGTNRTKFFRGEIDKYTWVDIGSSYLPGEIIAAFLYAQMEDVKLITQKRLDIWKKYNDAFENLEKSGFIRRPIVPVNCQHNAHMYYLLLPNQSSRSSFIDHLKTKEIHSVFHYIPLHNSPAGLKYGMVHGNLNNTISLSERIVRLPLWIEIENYQDYIIETILRYFEGKNKN